MKVIIDRFEGNYAVCEKEDRAMIDISREKLPAGVKEGDVLDIVNEKISINIQETEKRKKEREELAKGIWE